MALLLAGIGIALIAYNHQALTAATKAQTQAKATANSLHDQYINTARDEALLRETIERFNSLRDSGLIQAEDRLRWADELREIRSSLRIPRLDYELQPQRVLRNLDAKGEHRLHASQMKLTMDLLHEGDLLRILERLQTRRDAIVLIRECNLDRAAANTTGAQMSHTLKANCTLDWISLHSPRTANNPNSAP